MPDESKNKKEQRRQDRVEQAKAELQKLADLRFHGVIELGIQDGHITTIKRTETLKLDDV